MRAAHLISLATLAVTFGLEAVCIGSRRRVLEAYGRRTYSRAVAANLVNNGLVGPALYATVDGLWLRDDPSWLILVRDVALALSLQTLLYYTAHRAMHARLMSIHAFHHTFSHFVSPMVASAVSLPEYLFAYILPFWAAAWLLRPGRLAFGISVGLVSLCNLLVHTPALQSKPGLYGVPKWWVSADDHLAHHRTRRGHYAAPTLNLDWLVDRIATEDGGRRCGEPARPRASHVLTSRQENEVPS